MDDNTYARPMDADVDPIAYFKKLRAANCQRRFKENHPDYVVKKKAYDAQRKGRSGKRFPNKSHIGGNFIAIDVEGMDIGAQFRLGKNGAWIYYLDADTAKQIRRMINARIIARYYGWRAVLMV
jgi:hypothetical protein